MNRVRRSLAVMLVAGGLAAYGAIASPLAGAQSVVPGGSPAAVGTVDAPRVVQLSIGDGSIDPAVVNVAMGETIRFVATNATTAGEVELIVGPKAQVDADEGADLKEAEHIAPGANDFVEYTFDTAGPWGYGDQVDDHYAKGAKGDVIVAGGVVPGGSTAAVGTVDAPRVVQLSIGDGSIDPAVVNVAMGETIRFVATNATTAGEVELIVGPKAQVDADEGADLKEAEHIAPGANDFVEYTFDTAGPWGYGDQVDDHYAKGAKGDVIVAP